MASGNRRTRVPSRQPNLPAAFTQPTSPSNETGTVAAAATALDFAESGPPEPEFTIAADKPFFYVIRHNETGAVLFSGQVTNPTT